MGMKPLTGLGNFSPPTVRAARRSEKASFSAAASPDRSRDTLELRDGNCQTPTEIEVNGRKFSVSDEIGAFQERVKALSAMRVAMEAAERNAEAAKRQAKVIAEQAKAQAKALEIYRRIATGGRVPPEDEDFLQNFSPELYLAAKMAALTAKERKDYDSVLEDKEETPESGEAASETPTADAVSTSADVSAE